MDDWTKRKFDTEKFIMRLDKMRRGESTLCPFCGGHVRLTLSENGKDVFACDSCDMKIETEHN